MIYGISTSQKFDLELEFTIAIKGIFCLVHYKVSQFEYKIVANNLVVKSTQTQNERILALQDITCALIFTKKARKHVRLTFGNASTHDIIFDKYLENSNNKEDFRNLIIKIHEVIPSDAKLQIKPKWHKYFALFNAFMLLNMLGYYAKNTMKIREITATTVITALIFWFFSIFFGFSIFRPKYKKASLTKYI